MNTQNRNCTSILSLLLWAIITITTLLGFVPAAVALEYNKEILLEADFSGRDLTDSSFTKANLRYSNFSNSTLDSARLIKADLTNAILEGAFAANVRFDGAIVDGADFTDVLLRPDEQKKLCKLAKGTNPITGRQTKDTLFCP
jgi:uncharacterized protein YjbI with pentapeptide repeats